MADGNGMDSVEAHLMASAMAGLKSDFSEVKLTLVGMQKAMEALVRMDEQQNNQRAAISRAFDELNKERDRREQIEKRIHLLEVDAPSYKELRQWVIGGVLTGIIALLGSMFAIVFKIMISDPVERNFQRQFSPGIAPQTYTVPAERLPVILKC